jgi:pimeloyl-ACP methyl ester carboxylesterase
MGDEMFFGQSKTFARECCSYLICCQIMAVAPEKPPLVLLHPATSSGRIWQDVVPLLSEHHEVHAPTLLGHRGGPAAQRRPATFTDLVDSAERYLDERGLDRPHLAGNSGGGAVAIELARRGRAATVCAISPAGFWSAEDGSATRVLRKIRVGGRVIRLIRPIAPLVLKWAAARRIILRNFVCHGERLSAARALDLYVADPMGCTIMDDLAASGGAVEPLDPLPCPITLAWAEVDRFFPATTYGRTARERLPGATWIALPGVGHNAMVDDPGLVARIIMAVTGVGV